MPVLRRTKASYFFIFLIALLILYIVKLFAELRQTVLVTDFTHFDNVQGSSQLIVPNIVHFVHFDKEKISFLGFICILSAHYNHRPNLIFLHTNVELQGRYFKTLESVIASRLKIVHKSKPSHVFGQKLSSVQHSADIAKLKILIQYGGIVLDEDVFVVKSLNKFRHFEVALGWPEGQNIGSQVLLAARGARLPPLWLALYREYRPSMWYYNAGEAPTRSLLEQQPELVHRVKNELGVENLAEQLYKKQWAGWHDRHTIHMLERHNYLTNSTPITEDNYKECQFTIGEMVRSIMEAMADEDIVWSGEWLRLNDVTQKEDLRAKVEHFLNSSSESLLHRHLSLDLFNQLESVKSPSTQGTLGDQIRSGLTHLDSSIGVYASDPDAYTHFGSLFNPIIRDYHNVRGKLLQPPQFWGEPTQIGDLSGEGGQIVSTRIRTARSLQGFPLNSKMTMEDYLSLEHTAMEAFKSLDGELAGNYLSLAVLSPQEREKLISQHLLFGQCDRFLEAAQACRHWPAGRGVFINNAQTFVVWVGEEDHLRIFSIQQGGNLGAVYSRLVDGLGALEAAGLVWARSPSLGFLTFCPSNLGTTLRASIHLKARALTESEVRNLSEREDLQVRGTHGEHTENVGGVLDISNSRRLGQTEFMILKGVYRALVKLIKEDNLKASQR